VRVALFTDTFTPQVNGVARTLSRWSAALAARGHETLVFAPSVPGAASVSHVRRHPSVPFWAYPELRIAMPGARGICAELVRFQPDLVHVATPFGVGLAGRAAALSLGIPLVSSYHTSFTQYARFYGLAMLARPGVRYLRWFHNAGRRTFVPTAAIKAELDSAGFRDVALWTRGVDTEQFNPRFRDPSRRRSMVGERGCVVAYVGRLAAEKGVPVAMRAMTDVVRRRPSVRLAVAGDGPDEIRCRRLSPPGSWFAGRLGGTQLSAFYASADIFVFPSTTDTFGNVLFEAMASGLAIVAADVPQSREAVGDEAGVFTAPNDSTELADAITALIDNPERLSAMRRAALARVQSRGWDAVFDQLMRDYEDALCIPDARPSSGRSTAGSLRARDATVVGVGGPGSSLR
jgi:glycosyltransferase involved in cell wall biosynthesis